MADILFLKSADSTSIWDADLDTGIEVDKDFLDDDVIRFHAGGITDILKITSLETTWNDDNLSSVKARFAGFTKDNLFVIDALTDAVAINSAQTQFTINGATVTPQLTMKREATGNVINQFLLSDSNTVVEGAFNVFARARHNTTTNAFETVLNGDRIGVWRADAHNGTQFVTGASVVFFVDGAIGAGGNVPTRISFYTDDGTSGNSLRASISPKGWLGIGTAAPFAELDVRGAVLFNNANGDNDFRVAGLGTANLFRCDAGTNTVGMGQSGFGTTAKFGATSIIFNELAGDIDTRIETQGDTHALFIDAGTNRIGISASVMKSTFEIAGSRGQGVTTLNAATLTLGEVHAFIAVTYTATGAVTITLPSATSSWNSTDNVGRTYEIADCGANASVNNITINRAGTDTIISNVTGGTSVVINGNGDTIKITAINSSTWKIH